MNTSNREPTDAADPPVDEVWEEQGTPGRSIDRAGVSTKAEPDQDEVDAISAADEDGPTLPG